MSYVILNKKKIQLFNFQEELAIKIAKKLIKGESNISIEIGTGRRIIIQRVADILDHKNVKYLYDR